MPTQEETANLTGVGKNEALRMTFDGHVKLEFRGFQVTFDAGLLAYRELDEALDLTVSAEDLLNDWRMGQNTQHSLVALLRQTPYSRLAGYEDTNDAERLAVDPAMRQVSGGRATEHPAASTSQMGRFETEVLTRPKSRSVSGQELESSQASGRQGGMGPRRAISDSHSRWIKG